MHGKGNGVQNSGILREVGISGGILGALVLALAAAFFLSSVPPSRIQPGATQTPANKDNAIGMVGGGTTATNTPPPTSTPLPATPKASLTLLPTATATKLQKTQPSTRETAETASATPTWPAPTATPIPSRIPTMDPDCPAPSLWKPYVVSPRDTLSSLASVFGTSEWCIRVNNQLEDELLEAGQHLLLPLPTATPTPFPTPCGPPAGWTVYTVSPGDTLGSLTRTCGTTIAAVQNANCLASTTIYSGQRLFLPCQPVQPTLPPPPTWPAITPIPTATPGWPTITPTAYVPTPWPSPTTPLIPPTSTPTIVVPSPTSAPEEPPPTSTSEPT